MPDPTVHRTFYTLASVVLVSGASLVGMLTLALGRRLRRALPYLVSLAAGALLGAAAAHLLPEAVERLGAGRRFSALLIAGFLGFFLLERTLSLVFGNRLESTGAHAHHGHSGGPTLIANILLGGAIHSLIDGVAVASAYTASASAGLATTIAVLLHEVPHHIGDVGVLIYGGLPRRRAVLLNLLATASAVLGACIVLLAGSKSEALTSALLPITAASFFYIAVANLMPELQRERNVRRSIGQVAVLLAGAALLFASSAFLGP
ncbi:MAG: ZIP family metal transporter [Acidobacteriota bacterium]|nr:ZIP family metal transporter [Acidobacteriota bacterium]